MKRCVFFIVTSSLLMFHNEGMAQKLFFHKVDDVLYAGIDSDDMFTRDNGRGVVKRKEQANFLVNCNLYTYSTDGKIKPAGASEPILENGVPKVVKRITKLDGSGKNAKGENVDNKVSHKFIVSPTDIYSNGGTTSNGSDSLQMNWATANGYLATANTVSTAASSATLTGCSNYKGKNGKDAAGTWRMPTKRELLLMVIFSEAIEKTRQVETGFVKYIATSPLVDSKLSNGYWTATGATATGATRGYFYRSGPRVTTYYGASANKTAKHYIRCIRDID